MHCLSVMPRAGCILPLRVVMTVRWVSARSVIAPYGVDCKCGKLFGKFLLFGAQRMIYLFGDMIYGFAA